MKQLLFIILASLLLTNQREVKSDSTFLLPYADYCELMEMHAMVILNKNADHKIESTADSIYSAFCLEQNDGVFSLLVEDGCNSNGDIRFHREQWSGHDIYVYSAQYQSPLVLYALPNMQDSIMCIDSYITDPLYVQNVEGAWLLISTKWNGIEYRGWIPRTEYCANPESTCN